MRASSAKCGAARPRAGRSGTPCTRTIRASTGRACASTRAPSRPSARPCAGHSGSTPRSAPLGRCAALAPLSLADRRAPRRHRSRGARARRPRRVATTRPSRHGRAGLGLRGHLDVARRANTAPHDGRVEHSARVDVHRVGAQTTARRDRRPLLRAPEARPTAFAAFRRVPSPSTPGPKPRNAAVHDVDRSPPHVGGRALLHDAPVAHHDDAVGDRERLRRDRA